VGRLCSFKQNKIKQGEKLNKKKTCTTDTPILALTVGPSGSGKGFCVGDIFAEFHGVHTFVTGEWCRLNAEGFSSRGELAPDDIINNAVETHFLTHSDCFYNIDAPRTVKQAIFLIRMYRNKHPDCRIVTFHIDATHDQSFALISHRAKRQRRQDDTLSEAVEKRLKTYFKQGGILETLIPFLEKESDDFVSIQHKEFDNPLQVTNDGISEIMVATRKYMQIHVAPGYFERPDNLPVVAPTAPIS